MLAASREVAVPRLLAMLAVIAVFIPSFFMTGPAQALFMPLSLAVGFSMGASYRLTSTLAPVLSNWILELGKILADRPAEQRFDRFRQHFGGWLDRLMAHPAIRLIVYVLGAGVVLWLVAPNLPREIFPASTSTQLRLRFDAPDGTRVPVTEEMARRVLETIQSRGGRGQYFQLGMGAFLRCSPALSPR